MKIKLLNVVWHDKEPVFSIDWHPSGRIATGGADKEVKIWRLEGIGSATPTVKFVCSLARHMGTVNAVRFSPNGRFLASGSDDGFICIWELQGDAKYTPKKKDKEAESEAKEGKNKEEEEEEEEEEETWTVYKSIKAPARDVYDIAWSACSRFILGGTSENTSFVGSARSGSVLYVGRDHYHFIQGVSWDPRNKYVVTQSSDQTARVYTTSKGNSGKLQIKYVIRDLRLPGTGAQKAQQRKQTATSTQPPPPPKKKKRLVPKAEPKTDKEGTSVAEEEDDDNIFDLENNGEEEEKGDTSEGEEEEEEEDDEEDAVEEAKSTTRPKMFLSEVANTFFRRNSWSPDGSLLILPAGIFRTQIGSSGGEGGSNSTDTVKVANTAYVFSRGDFRRPICHFPGHEKVVVATRFCPVLFRLRTKSPAVPLPYRMVVAIATTDSVAVYDTETMHALGAANKVHFSEITDLAWIEDKGLHLIMSSRDGFCSLISFEKGELGEPLPKAEYPEVMEKIREIRNTPFKAQIKEQKDSGSGNGDGGAGQKGPETTHCAEKHPRKRITPVLVPPKP